MFDFGDELAIEGSRIPWLIWIQILIFFLLIFLVYCFSVFPSDLSDTSTTTSSSSSSASPPSISLSISHNSHLGGPILKHSNTTTTVTNRLHHNQVEENQSIKGEIATSTGRRTIREINIEREGSLLKDANYIDYHPCNYFRLAKLAFLKCFGLDHTSENSSSSEQNKER